MSTRPPNTDFNSWMRDVERRLLAMERRPSILNAAELLGPGVAAYATEVSNWNDDTLSFNGFYFSQPGSINSPDPLAHWMGTSMADPDGRGFQRLTNYRDPDTEGVSGLYPAWPGATFVRSFYASDGTSTSWSTWQPEHPTWWDASNADVALTDTTYHDVPGLSIDIDVRSAMEVYMVSINLHCLHNDTTGSNVYGQLTVDGVAQDAFARYGAPSSVANTMGSASNTWMITGLSEGTRTFSVQARLSGAGNYSVQANNSTMSIIRTT